MKDAEILKAAIEDEDGESGDIKAEFCEKSVKSSLKNNPLLLEMDIKKTHSDHERQMELIRVQ